MGAQAARRCGALHPDVSTAKARHPGRAFRESSANGTSLYPPLKRAPPPSRTQTYGNLGGGRNSRPGRCASQTLVRSAITALTYVNRDGLRRTWVHDSASIPSSKSFSAVAAASVTNRAPRHDGDADRRPARVRLHRCQRGASLCGGAWVRSVAGRALGVQAGPIPQPIGALTHWTAPVSQNRSRAHSAGSGLCRNCLLFCAMRLSQARLRAASGINRKLHGVGTRTYGAGARSPLHNARCATIDAVLIRTRRRTGPEVFHELQRREWWCESAPLQFRCREQSRQRRAVHARP